MKSIVIATNNKNKIKEIKSIFNLKNVKLLTLNEVGINFEVDEDKDNFICNAEKKAIGYFNACGIPVIAEDSGLCVRALNGYPGVHSKRICEGTNKTCNEIILEKMDGVEDRYACFNAVYCYHDGLNTIFSEGTAEGEITFEEIGENGFEYDKIFKSSILGKTFAEVSERDKNTVSHRRDGLKHLKRLIEPLFNDSIDRINAIEKAKDDIVNLFLETQDDCFIKTIRVGGEIKAIVEFGEAKCRTGASKVENEDTFNQYIGLAIAIRRALNKKVPLEYLDLEPLGKEYVKDGDIVSKDGKLYVYKSKNNAPIDRERMFKIYGFLKPINDYSFDYVYDDTGYIDINHCLNDWGY